MFAQKINRCQAHMSPPPSGLQGRICHGTCQVGLAASSEKRTRSRASSPLTTSLLPARPLSHSAFRLDLSYQLYSTNSPTPPISALRAARAHRSCTHDHNADLLIYSFTIISSLVSLPYIFHLGRVILIKIHTGGHYTAVVYRIS